MIDTHAHLHLIKREPSEILQAAKESGVRHIIQVAIDFESIHQNISDYSDLQDVSITGGIHPLSVNSTLDIDLVMDYLSNHRDALVAIGETGLDYKYGKKTKPLQLAWFHAQLDLARRINKPVIIHSRHADEDMLAVVNQYPDVPKVFHCYATHVDFFDALVGSYNYVSFTGMITYAKKGKVANSVRKIPLDRMMIETDAPYLLPKGVLADQNAPEYVSHIAEHIAVLKKLSIADVVQQTTQTACEFFNINIPSSL